MAEAQARLQTLSDTYQTLQTELKGIVDGRQTLESQMQENSTVLTELELLKDNSTQVHKKVGPVLMKQTKGEALMSVKGRIEFITNEIKRAEEQIHGVETKIDGVKQEIFQIQSTAPAPATA